MGLKGKLKGNPFFYPKTVFKNCCICLKVSFWGMTADIHSTLSQLLEESKFFILKQSIDEKDFGMQGIVPTSLLQPLCPPARETEVQGH